MEFSALDPLHLMLLGLAWKSLGRLLRGPSGNIVRPSLDRNAAARRDAILGQYTERPK